MAPKDKAAAPEPLTVDELESLRDTCESDPDGPGIPRALVLRLLETVDLMQAGGPSPWDRYEQEATTPPG